tara:strand:+ start:67 stop:630 length:564 start_codon:yes stop_codon:yes gene_type:complete
MINREDYFDRDTRRIELNDDVDTISSIIEKSKFKYKYFSNLTFPQEPGSYWEGTSRFVYFLRKLALKWNTHILPIWGIEPLFHRFGIHLILLSEKPFLNVQITEEWKRAQSEKEPLFFGVGGLATSSHFNPASTGVGYIFERHIQHVVGKVFCPRRKRCRARCKCSLPFERLTARESDSRIIRALKH